MLSSASSAASASSSRRSRPRRERCRPPGRRRAASSRRALPEQLPRVRAEGHRSAAEVAHGSARAGLPKPPQHATPRVARRPRLPAQQRRRRRAMVPALTWIGHASMLVQAGGANVLTDPMFSERASPFGFVGPKRHAAAGAGARRAAAHRRRRRSRTTTTTISTTASVKALAAQAGGPPLFVVPLGVKAWFADVGIRNAVELDWWQSARVGAVEIVLTPVQHWSGRIADRPHGDALGRLRDLRARLPGLLRRRHRVLEGLRRHPRALRGAPRRRARLRPGAAADRRLRAALVHERAAHRPGGSGADPPATSAPSARSASTGARSSSPTSRSTSRRRRWPARRARPASPTTPSA